jgi:FkbH-like protein
MYETEANQKTRSIESMPAEVSSQLERAKHTVTDRTVLPWSEHCTECVWPTCYTTCDLYDARQDGKCRRFVHGMERIDCPEALNSYVLKITFKRWGKLWAPGNIHLRPIKDSQRVERRDYQIGNLIQQLPVPAPARGFLTRKRYSVKKRLAYRTSAVDLQPTSFLMECYNPSSHSVSLSLSIRAIGEKHNIPFQQLIELKPGFNCARVPFNRMARVVGANTPFNIELIPNDDSKETTLYFGLIDFVRELEQAEPLGNSRSIEPKQKVKCVVWDLDNTIWHGVLVEDGPEKLVLKEGIRQIFAELDERGILQSVATKNNHDEAMAMLKHLGIAELFLVPQISWEPKSNSLREIARRLNVGLDSLLFIDDSPFERREVETSLRDVRTMDAEHYREIVDLEECKGAKTIESQQRRKSYQVEGRRQEAAAGYAEDYIAFLKDCDIRMTIYSMAEENLERVHELTQRTNQMNFSGNRYDRAVLKDLLLLTYLDTYVIEVEDRFGSYGVVGFCIVDGREPLMTDLMFSCRIQSKRVEHAFLTFLIRQYIAGSVNGFFAHYRKTSRNAPSGKVFSDIGMIEVENCDGVSRLKFDKEQAIADDGLIIISAPQPCATT